MPPARALRRDRGHRLSRGALDRAVDYLHRNLPRWAFGYDSSAVVRLALSRDDLFTSRRPGDLLVYAEDYDKARWTVGEWDGFACRLLSLQQRIEADGRTAFLFLMIPDKSTAYADMLTPLDRSLDGFAVLARAHGLHMPRLDTILRSAIAGGLRDVYLPDDTHFGYAGTRLTAHAVLDYARPMFAGMPP
jgi:hypothetical protein